jgi:hypothetical protein
MSFDLMCKAVKIRAEEASKTISILSPTSVARNLAIFRIHPMAAFTTLSAACVANSLGPIQSKPRPLTDVE